MAVLRPHFDREAVTPWAIGVVALAGLIWVISWLLDTQQIGSQVLDEEVITQATAAPAEPVSTLAPLPLADLLPLGPEDDGFRVMVRGTVVAEPTRTGFWVLTDEDEVIFARTVLPAVSGQDVELTGTLRQTPSAEGEAEAAAAGLREAAGWKVHHALCLVVDTPAADGGSD